MIYQDIEGVAKKTGHVPLCTATLKIIFLEFQLIFQKLDTKSFPTHYSTFLWDNQVPIQSSFCPKLILTKRWILSKKKVDRPLAWGIEYTVFQCTNTPNFIFVIKQGGFGQTLAGAQIAGGHLPVLVHKARFYPPAFVSLVSKPVFSPSILFYISTPLFRGI